MFWEFMRGVGLILAGVVVIALLALLISSEDDSSRQEKKCIGEQCPSNFIEADAVVG